MLALPTAESGDLLRGCCEAEAAVAVGLVLAVRVHGAGGLVDGLVDDVVLQLRRSGRGSFSSLPSDNYHWIL